MRRTLIGLVAMGALVLGACGGDDDDSAGGSGEDFCSTIEELVQNAAADNADSEAAQQTLEELEPPDEIAEAWDEYVPLIIQGDEVSDDPEAQAEFRERVEGARDSASEIDQYLQDECGMTEAPSASGGGSESTTTAPG